MSAIQQLLTDHIDIWTDADTAKRSGRGRTSSSAGSVYGIKKLRELILELAVRGKLVPQDANDEPAGELLNRIRAEKERLVKAGKIRKDKPLSEIADEEKLFELPAGWERVRLGSQVVESGAGWSPSCEGHPRSGSEWGVLKVSAVSWGRFQPEENKALPSNLEPRLDCLVEIGDFLVSRANTAELVARSVVVEAAQENLLLSDKIVRLRLTDLCYPKYINAVNGCLGSRSYYARVAGGTSSSMKNVSREQILNLVLALPPLAEQHRIVTKVDELMALCDQLETQHNNATEAHEKLVSHLLGTLTQSQGAEDFSENWQRIAAHFDTLFTTEASIDALKQTLLQLAVMGKLVRQDARDEPASELLKKIRAEKDGLIKAGKIKKDKSLSEITDEDKPFDLPIGWEWARFPELGEFGRGKSKHRPRNDPSLFNPGVYPLVQTGEVARAGGVIEEFHSKYSVAGLAQSKMWPAGTLCITIAANIADSAMLGFDACFPDSVVGFLPHKPLSSSKYFLYFMKTARENLLKFAPATAQKNINLEILESVLIPIPPLMAGDRIVAKVDELMALCDQLKTRIIEANQLQQELAGVVVERAVA